MLDAAAIVHVDLPEYRVTAEPVDSDAPMSRRERLNSDSRKAAALQRTRKRIAREIEDNSAFSIVKLRLSAGLSQEELARMIGTQQPAIARLERGQSEPQISTIEKLAQAFGVSPEAVFSAFMKTRSSQSNK